MERVLFTRNAQTDLLEAWLFIAEDNPAAADRVLDAIEREAHSLSLQPLMGRARPELAEGVRSWPTSTPYILFYLADNESVTVLRVLHHARDMQRIDFEGMQELRILAQFGHRIMPVDTAVAQRCAATSICTTRATVM